MQYGTFTSAPTFTARIGIRVYRTWRNVRNFDQYEREANQELASLTGRTANNPASTDDVQETISDGLDKSTPLAAE
jgi:hypothetical protein